MFNFSKVVTISLFLFVLPNACFDGNQTAFEANDFFNSSDLESHIFATGSYFQPELGARLLTAIDNGDVNTIKKYVTGQNVNLLVGDTDEGWFLLERAVDVNNRDIAEFFLSQGAKTDLVGHEGYPLTAAVFAGNENMIQLLINAGASINAQDPALEGGTALFNTDNTDIINLLVSRGADINAIDYQMRTALIRAAMDGKTERCSHLINLNANINHQDEDGVSALMHAITYGLGSAFIQSHDEIVTLLVTAGADLNEQVKNHGNLSPLMIAAFRGNDQLTELLLKQGADVNAINSSGETALLTLARGYGKSITQMIETLANDNNKEVIDYFQNRFDYHYPRVLKLLLEYGADVRTMDNENKTIFDYGLSEEMSNILHVESTQKSSHENDSIEENADSPINDQLKKDVSYLTEQTFAYRQDKISYDDYAELKNQILNRYSDEIKNDIHNAIEFAENFRASILVLLRLNKQRKVSEVDEKQYSIMREQILSKYSPEDQQYLIEAIQDVENNENED